MVAERPTAHGENSLKLEEKFSTLKNRLVPGTTPIERRKHDYQAKSVPIPLRPPISFAVFLV